jgi:hypothetical protein
VSSVKSPARPRPVPKRTKPTEAGTSSAPSAPPTVAPVVEAVVLPVAPVVEAVVLPVTPVVEAVGPVAPVVEAVGPIAPVDKAVVPVAPVVDTVVLPVAPVVEAVGPIAPVDKAVVPVTPVVESTHESPSSESDTVNTPPNPLPRMIKLRLGPPKAPQAHADETPSVPKKTKGRQEKLAKHDPKSLTARYAGTSWMMQRLTQMSYI